MRDVVRVVGALLVADGSVLLGRRNPKRSSYPGVWDMPGGHVEPGERRWEALVRELREELGITPSPGRPWRRLQEHGVELTIWIVTDWSGAVVNLSPAEHAELRWFRAPEVGDLEFPHPAYTTLLAEAFASIAGLGPITPP